MAIDSSTVSIGEATKKSHFDQLIDNDKILNSSIIDLEVWNRGLMRLSLNNYNNTGTASVASGSILHVHDTVFEITATLSITNWSNILTGTVFMMMKKTGDYVTCEYTATSGSWNDGKQGYYKTNDRIIGELDKTAAGDYANKEIYDGKYGERPMQIETQIKDETGSALSADSIQDIDVTGFSFTPTAVLNVNITAWRSTSSEGGAGVELLTYFHSLFGSPPRAGASDTGNVQIIKATPGTNKVIVRIAAYNDTLYYRITCTAARGS